MCRPTVDSARKTSSAWVRREDEGIWKALQAGKLSDGESPGYCVVIRGVGLRVERPRPDGRMQATVRVVMTPRQPSSPIVRAPPLVREVTGVQVLGQVSVIPSRGDVSQTNDGVFI